MYACGFSRGQESGKPEGRDDNFSTFEPCVSLWNPGRISSNLNLYGSNFLYVCRILDIELAHILRVYRATSRGNHAEPPGLFTANRKKTGPFPIFANKSLGHGTNTNEIGPINRSLCFLLQATPTHGIFYTTPGRGTRYGNVEHDWNMIVPLFHAVWWAPIT